MKPIITFILLLIMIVQTAGLYQVSLSKYNSVQDIDEKNEDVSKENKKKSDALVSSLLSFHGILSDKAEFNISHVIMISSPVIDHLAPPPDRVFVS